MEMAEQLIGSLRMDWKPARYTDTYRRDVLQLVKDLARGKRVKRRAARAPEATKVVDLMEALKNSVAAGGRSKGGGHRSHPRRRSAARKEA
jgi:DNA end-binding protein Ku